MKDTYEGQIDAEAAEYECLQRHQAYENYMKELCWIEHPNISINELVEALLADSIVAREIRSVLKRRQLELFSYLDKYPDEVKEALISKIYDQPN